MKENSFLSPQGAAKWMINIAVLASEIRVYMTMEALTGSKLTAALALFGTGVWFILWYDILDTHPLATKAQKIIDGLFTFWSLVMGAIFVFADFAVKTSLNGIQINVGSLIVLLAVSTFANIVGAIVWTRMDTENTNKRKLATKQAEQVFKLEQMKGEEQNLIAADKTLKHYIKLLEQYGEDALDALKVEVPELAEAAKKAYAKSAVKSASQRPANAPTVAANAKVPTPANVAANASNLPANALPRKPIVASRPANGPKH